MPPRSSRQLQQAVDRIIESYVAPDGPGISLLIGRGKRILIQKGYGMAHVERRVPVEPGTRFLIASVSKQFTAMAIMLLKHRGLLAYDEPIARFFPDFPTYRNRVTIRQLLTHTSGVREYLTKEYFEAVEAGAEFDLAGVIDLIRDLGDLEFEPGSRWRYCNSGYVMLGAIVEKVSGRSFATFLRDHVFVPLNMTSTVVGESGEHLAGQAIGYTYRSRADFEAAPYSFSANVGWADGNIISTTQDLFKWGQALYTRKLLPLEELAAALVPCNPLDPSFSRYGFGQGISERRGVREVHHSGGIGGYVSWFSRFTDEQLTIILLSNAAGVDLASITGSLAELLLENKLAPIVPVDLDQGLLLEVAGSYGGKPRDVPITMEVALEEGSLVATFWDRRRAQLVPLGRDFFRCVGPADVYIQFLRDTRGGVTGVRVLSGGMVSTLHRLPAVEAQPQS
ncbi:MAG: serine hydrolase domain-containing protein [Bacillota bacterium]